MEGPAALLLLMLLAAPSALAHGAAFETSAWTPSGRPVDVEIDGAPVVVAGEPLRLVVRAPRLDGLEEVSGIWASLTPLGGTPGGGFALEPRGMDHVGRVAFDRPGQWTLTVSLEPSGESFATAFTVWPSASAFLELAPSSAARGALVAGARESLALRVHTATGAPAVPIDDALARVTHESEDGRTLDTRTISLPRVGDEYVLQGTWEEAGRLHVEVEAPAWDLRLGDQRPLSVLLVNEDERAVYTASAESAAKNWAPWLMAGLASAALLIIVLRLRR